MRLSQGAACLFDTQGQLSAFLDAFFWVGVDLGIFGRVTVFEARQNFFNAVIAQFNFGCADPSADITLPIVDLDVNGDGIVESNVLELQYTPGPGQPNDPERGEKYRVTQRDGILVVTSHSNADTFDVSEVGTIYVTGTPNNDEYIFGPNRTANLYINGAGGNDVIRVDGEREASRTLLGGAGSDMITGSLWNDSIDGGPGNDMIEGRDGDDTIRGGDGATLIDAGPASTLSSAKVATT